MQLLAFVWYKNNLELTRKYLHIEFHHPPTICIQIYNLIASYNLKILTISFKFGNNNLVANSDLMNPSRTSLPQNEADASELILLSALLLQNGTVNMKHRLQQGHPKSSPIAFFFIIFLLYLLL